MDSEVQTEPAPTPEPGSSSPAPTAEPESSSPAPTAEPESSSPAEAAAWLSRNAVDSLPEGALEKKLAEGRPLRVKLGIDPTAPDIHLGHTVVLQKLREFQDLGHEVVLVIGDYTARVGDPSGRSATRPALSGEEIDANARTFTDQAYTVLDPDRSTIRFNGEWLDMSMEDLFRLARIPTVGQLLERDDFAKRFAAHAPISVLELLYPLMQGYDSVAIRADVELGGTDQKFNLLLGRDIQRAYGIPEQAILTMPLLPGTDGVTQDGEIDRQLHRRQRAARTRSTARRSASPTRRSAPGIGCSWAWSRRPSSGPATPSGRLPGSWSPASTAPTPPTAAEREFDRVHIARQAPEDMPRAVAGRPARRAPAGAARARVRDHEVRGAPQPRPGRGQARRRDGRQRLARPAGGRGRRQDPPAGQASVRARARGSVVSVTLG